MLLSSGAVAVDSAECGLTSAKSDGAPERLESRRGAAQGAPPLMRPTLAVAAAVARLD
jgi:hypothetical protein